MSHGLRLLLSLSLLGPALCCASGCHAPALFSESAASVGNHQGNDDPTTSRPADDESAANDRAAGQPDAPHGKTSSDVSAARSSAMPSTPDAGFATDSLDLESLKAALASDAWYRRPDSKRPPVWHHPQLVDWLASGEVDADVWRRYLDDDDPVVRANAAIALARSGWLREARRLGSIVEQPKLRLEQRLAAAEALALLPAEQRTAEVDRLLEQFGTPDKHRRGYIADLHAELLRGLVHEDLRLDDPRVLAALEATSPAVRAAALETWATRAAMARIHPTSLPRPIALARQDRDPRVRRAALHALAASGGSRARSEIEASLDDHDLSVRRAAIAALGRLAGADNDSEALAKLRSLLKDGAELDRIAAVEALAEARLWDELRQAIDDRAWRVRRAVALALQGPTINRQPPDIVRELLGRLAIDSNSQVQAAAMETLAQWPIAASGAILIDALEKAGYHARCRAIELLSNHWQAAHQVTLDANGRVSPEQIARLRAAWQARAAPLSNRSVASKGPSPPPVAVNQLDKATLDTVQALIEQIAHDDAVDVEAKLRQIVPDVGKALEQLIVERNVRLPRTVLRKLASSDPVLEQIARLEQQSTAERHRTVRKLVELAAEEPLRPLARHFLAQVVHDEDDALVWQQVWPLLFDDTSDLVEALAFRCLVHPSPQVRRLACRYFGRHRRRESVASLIEVLRDEQPSVIVEAIDALSQENMLDDPAPLIELLNHSSPEVRLKSAQALAKLDVAEGIHALERAAYDPDVRVRSAAARALGELEREELAGILVGMLDDSRLSVRRAAMKALQQLAGRDVGRPDDDRAPRLSDEVRRWKQWWARRQTAPNLRRVGQGGDGNSSRR